MGKCEAAERSLRRAEDLLIDHPDVGPSVWVPVIGAWVCAAAGDPYGGVKRARLGLGADTHGVVSSSASRAMAKIAVDYGLDDVGVETNAALPETLT
ncbi:MAG: hypothetical protein ACI9MC_001502 [Kiritimatiellia bacterium]